MAAADTLASSKKREDPAGTPRIEWVPIGALRLNPRNARTHSRKQINQIAASIKKFGFLNPVLVDDADMVIALRPKSLDSRGTGAFYPQRLAAPSSYTTQWLIQAGVSLQTERSDRWLRTVPVASTLSVATMGYHRACRRQYPDFIPHASRDAISAPGA